MQHFDVNVIRPMPLFEIWKLSNPISKWWWWNGLMSLQKVNSLATDFISVIYVQYLIRFGSFKWQDMLYINRYLDCPMILCRDKGIARLCSW